MDWLTSKLTRAMINAADQSPLPDEPPIDPSRITPGLLGLVTFVFLIVAVAFLYRSMRKQMNRIATNLPSSNHPRKLSFEPPVEDDGSKPRT